MSMNIGILTLPLKDNYGGLLQVLSLYYYLSGLGYKVEIIRKDNYANNYKKLAERIFEIAPFQNYRNIRSRKINSLKQKKWIDNLNINLSPKLFTKKDMAEYAQYQKFDAIIVGSDQVWRLEYIDKTYYKNYFLDFVDSSSTKKISYAASFGHDYFDPKEKFEEISNCIQDFNFISVREKSAIGIAKDLGAKEVSHVVDPTLLHSADFYKRISENDSVKSVPQVLAYTLDESQDMVNLINFVSDKTNVSSINYIYTVGSKIQKYSIGQWLKSFENADFVVTDSFHGMLFSIIFKKQFIVVCNKSRGSSRFESMLNKLNLEHRLIYSYTDEQVSRVIINEINYDEVDKKLNEFVEDSKIFLQSALA